jgi:ribosomal protein L29
MKDIRNKNIKDLVKFIAEKREEIRTLRFKAAGSGMRDTKSINAAKKELARGLTELNARAK